MADLIPVPGNTPVPQIETNTRVLGGAGGPANQQAQALLNRVELLKERADKSVLSYEDFAAAQAAAADLPGGQVLISMRDELRGGRKTWSLVDSGDAVYSGLFDSAATITDFYVTGEADHTGMFIRAAQSGNSVIVNSVDGPFSLSGTIPISTGTSILFQGIPVINITVDGDSRGFWFAPGTSDALIAGAAIVNITTNTAGAEGSFNSAFCFGQFYTVEDLLPVLRCSIIGPIQINCVGTANSKPVHVYGYSENCLVDFVWATGRTNFTFSAHWAGNGAPGVLASKTWHPHNLVWRRCRSFSTVGMGATLRSFTAAACGRVMWEDCESLEASTLGFNLFVGDYGYTYAQNISQREAYQYHVRGGEVRQVAGAGFSADAQSSGLNGSPIWSGCDNWAKVDIDDLDILIGSSATSVVGAAFSLQRIVSTKNLRIIEEGVANTAQALTVFGVRSGELNGEMVSRFGALYRASGQVIDDMLLSTPLPEPDLARYGISASATSATCTSLGAVAIGGTSITLVGNTLVTGAGGFIRFNDGTTTHEIDLLTSTYSTGNQTVLIPPSPVSIPDSSAITVIQTVKRLEIRLRTKEGHASGLRTTGSSIAKVRNVLNLGHYIRCGVLDVDYVAVDGVVDESLHSYSGQRTTTTNRRGISFGADAEGYNAMRAKFDKTCGRLQYSVYCHDSSKNGFVGGGNQFESINMSATNPAAIFKNLAANVYVDPNTNIVSNGVPLKYPA